MMQLDLSRRRVAAVSFLSNISVTELTDEQKSEQDNLHCLRVCKLFMKFCEIILPALEPKLEDLKLMGTTPYLAQFFFRSQNWRNFYHLNTSNFDSR